MLTDPKLRSQVDSLWDKLWTGGLSNPLDAIEQLSYLIFLKRLDDRENVTERQATRRGERYTPSVPAEMRWGHWTQLEAGKALAHLRDAVFPWLRGLGASVARFWLYQCATDSITPSISAPMGPSLSSEGSLAEKTLTP